MNLKGAGPQTLDYQLLGFVIALIAPALLVVAVQAQSAPQAGAPKLGLGVLLLVLFFLTEVRSMKSDSAYLTGRDRGIASAALTIAALLYIPLGDRLFTHVFLVTRHEDWWLNVGILLCGCGWALRRAAANELGSYFTHALTVRRNQIIIDSGVYKYIRHPSYLGTIILVPGFSFAFGTFVSLFILPVVVAAAVSRINREEAMLTEAFSEQYAVYKASTYRLLPGVY